MEPSRRSARLKEKAEPESPLPDKKGKTRSQTRSKQDTPVQTTRSKSVKAKDKSPAKNDPSPSNSRSKRSSVQTRSASTSGRKSGSGAKAPATKSTTNQGKGEKARSASRKTRTKRKADNITEGDKNKRSSTSAKKVKKGKGKAQESDEEVEKVSKRKGGRRGAKQQKEEEEDEDEEEEEVKLDESLSEPPVQEVEKKVEKKTNKKKIEGTNKQADAAKNMQNPSANIRVLEILVTVKGSHYSIWRKILVTDEIPFTKFARTIVWAMGWLGIRDWEFVVNNVHILLPPDDDDDREDTTEFKRYADEVYVNSFNLQKDSKIVFNYGTDENPWVHEVLIENVHSLDRNPKGTNEKAKSATHGVVLTGMYNAPRDDFSPKDYDKAMDMFHKSSNDYNKDWKDKLGESYDPEKYDKDAANNKMKVFLYDEGKMDQDILREDAMFRY